MANDKIRQNYKDIADAIRLKTGSTDKMSAENFPTEIGNTLAKKPSGNLSITENNTYDVSAYASAEVNVEGITPSGTKTITENGTDIDVYNYAYVDVNVDVSLPNIVDLRNYSYAWSYDGAVYVENVIYFTSFDIENDDTITTGYLDNFLINLTSLDEDASNLDDVVLSFINYQCSTSLYNMPSEYRLPVIMTQDKANDILIEYRLAIESWPYYDEDDSQETKLQEAIESLSQIAITDIAGRELASYYAETSCVYVKFVITHGS